MADVQFTITIPEAQAERVLAALARRFRYDPETDGPRGQFVKAKIIHTLKRMVRGQEVRDAQEAAEGNSIPDIT